jgi:hypothetical protein
MHARTSIARRKQYKIHTTHHSRPPVPLSTCLSISLSSLPSHTSLLSSLLEANSSYPSLSLSPAGRLSLLSFLCIPSLFSPVACLVWRKDSSLSTAPSLTSCFPSTLPPFLPPTKAKQACWFACLLGISYPQADRANLQLLQEIAVPALAAFFLLRDNTCMHPGCCFLCCASHGSWKASLVSFLVPVDWKGARELLSGWHQPLASTIEAASESERDRQRAP